MATAIAWVPGSAGLLGAALSRALRADGTELFVPAQKFTWHQPLELTGQVIAAVHDFAQRSQTAQRWEIHWAAGVGTMGSTADVMAPETLALRALLQGLSRESGLMARPGCISFASSAGAIYAGCQDQIITESSIAAPTTAYALEKLEQEALLLAFAQAHPQISLLLARFSTLYGSGQASAKKQGLLSHMARCIVRNQPIQIFVPFDTMRDYIHADDAAVDMIGEMRFAGQTPQALIKIIASESPTTIAEIVATFKRLSRRTPRVVRSANQLSALYTRSVKFRSQIRTGFERPPGKRLAVGISQLMRAEQLAFVKAPARSSA